MICKRKYSALLWVGLAAFIHPFGQPPDATPLLRPWAEGISEKGLEKTIQTLEGFVTRNTMSDSQSETQGIGAARRWLVKTFSAIPGLQVETDCYRLPAQGRRVVHPVELCNVLATLGGTDRPERSVVISAHYDTIAVSKDGRFDYQDTENPAPGADDDASGIAVLIESARVLKDLKPKASLVFAAFAGEEQGLLGATLLARKWKQAGKKIEAVVNLDMIGNVEGGNGKVEESRVRIFSEDPADSPSRELGRYIHRIASKLGTAFSVDLVFRNDRFGRGGDHTPFLQEGFPAVRLTEAAENYSRQHSTADILKNLSLSYCRKVAGMVCASAAAMAKAPPAPRVQDENGTPLLGRGKGYEARISWQWAGEKESLAGFRIYTRGTRDPFWQQSQWVSDATSYTMPDASIDDLVIGVSAVGQDGLESLISSYILPSRPPAKIIIE